MHPDRCENGDDLVLGLLGDSQWAFPKASSFRNRCRLLNWAADHGHIGVATRLSHEPRMQNHRDVLHGVIARASAAGNWAVAISILFSPVLDHTAFVNRQTLLFAAANIGDFDLLHWLIDTEAGDPRWLVRHDLSWRRRVHGWSIAEMLLLDPRVNALDGLGYDPEAVDSDEETESMRRLLCSATALRHYLLPAGTRQYWPDDVPMSWPSPMLLSSFAWARRRHVVLARAAALSGWEGTDA